MLQFEFIDSFIRPKLLKTRKVFNNNTSEIVSLELDKFMWENRWDLMFRWKIVGISFNLDVGYAIHDLHDELANHKRHLDLLIEG